MATGKTIRKAAVIGGGVMGRGIAAHLANARIPTLLLDIVPPEAADGEDASSEAFRNKFAAGAVERMKKEKPSPIFAKRDLSYITPGNVEDGMAALADVDFIIEAVPENMKIKRATFDAIEEHAPDHAIIASNTSGLSIARMMEGRSDSFQSRFLVMHFFNPVRYMKLLEIVPGEKTDQEIVDRAVAFGRDTLGKGIVFAKDTTNFIANRIGIYGMMAIMHAMPKYGMTPAGVDVLFGKPMGRPKSAVFGTADIVGLDTFAHVAKNCFDTLSEDEEREVFKAPEYVGQMLERGLLGRKSGAGFYKKEGKEILALNLETLEYEPREKPRFDSVGLAKKSSGGSAGSVRAIMHDGDDDAAKFAREVTLKTLAYAGRRLGEIADDLVNIDRGMRWGFNWELGPFETWDAVGVTWGLEKMKELGIEAPGWVTEMAASGHDAFYRWHGTEHQYYDPRSKQYRAVPGDERALSTNALKRAEKRIQFNDGASIYDAGDGVLALEFHTKMNTVDLDVITMMERAIEEMEGGDWRGLVMANDADNFSAGANLGLVVMAANNNAYNQIEELIERFQSANQRMRYSSKPVVAAPAGLTLGGGAEMTMGANAVVAAGELYMGLVEVGVGLIPGGAGTVQLLRNTFGAHAGDKSFPALPFIQKVFMNIGMAQVATSAEEAIDQNFLVAERDQVVLNRAHIMHAAKQRVIGMADAGWRPPRPTTFRLPGPDAYATVDMLLYSMQENQQISAHDRLIGQKLARVLTGGQTSPLVPVSEDYLLELEREAFMSLCGEEKSRERMVHMVMNNKPLRN